MIRAFFLLLFILGLFLIWLFLITTFPLLGWGLTLMGVASVVLGWLDLLN